MRHRVCCHYLGAQFKKRPNLRRLGNLKQGSVHPDMESRCYCGCRIRKLYQAFDAVLEERGAYG